MNRASPFSLANAFTSKRLTLLSVITGEVSQVRVTYARRCLQDTFDICGNVYRRFVVALNKDFSQRHGSIAILGAGPASDRSFALTRLLLEGRESFLGKGLQS